MQCRPTDEEQGKNKNTRKRMQHAVTHRPDVKLSFLYNSFESSLLNLIIGRTIVIRMLIYLNQENILKRNYSDISRRSLLFKNSARFTDEIIDTPRIRAMSPDFRENDERSRATAVITVKRPRNLFCGKPVRMSIVHCGMR
ncbi:hypothetical protein PUN28_010689 [Cardiocondyla obscurior]|uniref:Uncharacterized protein n=1 Tax=Cardiocondyla obscurior TaxID=286306 RepID=A0AAW2FHB3_9HYME